jgi:two-component system response regulator TctD
MRLLIVEDNRELAQAIADGFARRHVASDIAATAENAEHLFRTIDYSAMILDLGLPDDDGLNLVKRLRSAGHTQPLIILTARNQPEMRVEGLLAGADDYLAKPFLFDELHARLEAILRRSSGYLGRQLKLGELSLNTETRELSIGGATVDASLRETELLEILLRRKEHLVPRRLMEDQLFGCSDTLGSNAVEVYVHRVRRKLENHSAGVEIKTVRGVGYMLMAAAA